MPRSGRSTLFNGLASGKRSAKRATPTRFNKDRRFRRRHGRAGQPDTSGNGMRPKAETGLTAAMR